MFELGRSGGYMVEGEAGYDGFLQGRMRSKLGDERHPPNLVFGVLKNQQTFDPFFLQRKVLPLDFSDGIYARSL